MHKHILFITALLMSCTVSIAAQVRPVVPDTIRMEPPPNEEEPGKQIKSPELFPMAEIVMYNGQMLLRFSQPVSCGIQMADMDGQPVLTARMRDEAIAILDVSRLHGRFQLIIRSDRWFATKAYRFP